MPRKPRQIKLPREVRLQLSCDLGVLRHIKVLTNRKFAEIQQAHKEKETNVYDSNISPELKKELLPGWDSYSLIEAERQKQQMGAEIRRQCVYFIWLLSPFTHTCIKRNIEKPTPCDCVQCDCYQRAYDIKHKRGSCSFYIHGYRPHDPKSWYSRCLIHWIENPTLTRCADCQHHLEKSKWRVTTNLVPIDTGSAEIPTIHYHREKSKWDETREQIKRGEIAIL